MTLERGSGLTTPSLFPHLTTSRRRTDDQSSAGPLCLAGNSQYLGRLSRVAAMTLSTSTDAGPIDNGVLRQLDSAAFQALLEPVSLAALRRVAKHGRLGLELQRRFFRGF